MDTLLQALGDIPTITLVLLLTSLALAIFYEMINGFHDTANAVSMIIYTNSLKASHSVIMAGFMNFLGVLLGGIGVAYAIVHLLPLDIIVSSNQSATLIMIYSLLISAIVWNLGTWYFGIPASSSHALIGSIIGVGFAFGMMQGFDFYQSINWQALYKVLAALAISPLLGFGLAYIMMRSARKFLRHPKYYKTPQDEKKRKRPNFWMRMGIISTGAGVSFAHGSNDGQKGMGLIMIILIGILPSYYALDMNSQEYQIKQIQNSATNLAEFYSENSLMLDNLVSQKLLKSALKNEQSIAECDIKNMQQTTLLISNKLDKITTYRDLSDNDIWIVHNSVLCSDNFFTQVEKVVDSDMSNYIKSNRTNMVTSAEYVPLWVIITVALSISIGTMIGYKRIVLTIGEKIGSKPINYMQGTVSQAISAATILVANFMHAPVSTTHIVSSSVAGSMVAEPDGGVQKGMIKTIILSWVFTLPATAIMSSGIYYLMSLFIK